ncbi:hypothetical protein H0H92_008731 [Tricholoma furcatifolium]|nr:hypothetical protein H0H92_008731 [Tricholoma furcatifolium]
MTDSEKAHSLAADPEKVPQETSSVGSQSDVPASYDPAMEKVWRKIDWFVLPIVAMFYLLSFLDRTNLSNARVAGLQTDLKMTNWQYSVALTVTYVPYIFAELPSNLMLKAVGPNLVLPTMLTIWGIITTLQGAFSGILAYGIIKMNGVGNRPGWAWIFILEGLFTFLFGLSAFWTLPRSPAHARFLNEREKEYVISQLKETGATGSDEKVDTFSWSEVGKAFMLPQVQILALIFFFDGVILYGLAYFTPTIVSSLGYTGARAQLYSVPPFAVAFAVTMVGAYLSDRFGARGLVSMFAGVLATIGFAMFLASKSLHIKYGSLFLSISGAYSAAPALSTWGANNAAPYTRRATAIAIGFIMTNSGGILATWLLGTLSPAPLYRKATIICLIFSVLVVILSAVNVAYLHSQNKKKEQIRATTRREDEKPGLGDRSAWFVYNL